MAQQGEGDAPLGVIAGHGRGFLVQSDDGPDALDQVAPFKAHRFAACELRKTGLSDHALLAAVSEMESGLIDADLGGHLVKKRVALPGKGKRGGVRTILATKRSNRWFFLFGFSKSERANIDQDELKVLQEVAHDLLAFDDRQLIDVLSAGEIIEVRNGND